MECASPKLGHSEEQYVFHEHDLALAISSGLTWPYGDLARSVMIPFSEDLYVYRMYAREVPRSSVGALSALQGWVLWSVVSA